MKKINTIIAKINNNSIDSLLDKKALDDIKLGGEIINQGGLVAFPTETVYGLGGNALNPQSSLKIYKAKGRPSDNPLIVHIANIESIYPIVKNVPESAKLLMEKFWPGPMTLIMQKSSIVPYETTGGLDTVAIRLPSNEIARELIRQAKVPIAAPSANISGKPSPTKADHVIEDLSGEIDMVIDGGDCSVGLESTIIDLSTEIPAILRPGYITLEDVQKVIPNCIIDPAILKKPEKSSTALKPKAPGMKYKHYAPNAEMIIVESPKSENICNYVCNAIAEANDLSKKTGIISSLENLEYYKKELELSPLVINGNIAYYENKSKNIILHIFGEQNNPETLAFNLFNILREFNHENVDFIYSEDVKDNSIGMAVKNRLYKAAGYNIKHI